LGVAAFLRHGRLVPGDLACEDGRVVALGLTPRGHGIAIPGLVDLQVNGYGGIETLGASTEELSALGRALARDGVLAYQPTLISSEAARTKAAAARIADLTRLEPDGARILGIHLEGPFLSPQHAGAHAPERLAKADPELLRSLLDAGPITMVTLAPELPGALALVTECVRRSIAVSFGHSGADAQQARRGFEAGGRAVTHVFNAMTTISARAPGLAGAALADQRVTIQVIADGVHVADDLLLLVLSAARGRWNLVSDATAASSFGDGEHLLGEVRVFAEGGVVRRQDGTIAGSAAGLLDGIRHMAKLGAPLGEVLAAATERPAALLNSEDVGQIRLGARADIVVLDDELAIHEVLLEGRSLL
jgi:N-acetylglucosamine-6-phosphate deacetylase